MRQDRIEQDQDPPRSDLALSHVRVIPFYPTDAVSPHLSSAYFAPRYLWRNKIREKEIRNRKCKGFLDYLKYRNNGILFA